MVGTCAICGGIATSYHHRIFKSQNKALSKCKLNLVCLCSECHSEIHSKKGKELDEQLKLDFQNELEMLFIKEYFTKEEIKDLLEINSNAVNSLLEGIKRHKEGYTREEIIKTCMKEFYKE